MKLKSKEWSEEEIEGLYSRFVDGYNLLKNKYLRSVDHGNNRSELSKWNTLVMKHLKIDNMALFEIQ
ncbi:hypothetical protein [Fluviicola taffensis]|uniref:hypothetical protein n=1 Tax=Fluviicola taffensis TaxID=191579 RepID=UPI0011D2944F|nr:hypothetical protein [Fluviicola taffensis]